MELTMVAVIILLLLVVVLLSILILAIDSARKLAFGIVGLIFSGLFIIFDLACCVFAIYFGWNVLEQFLINQVFWWVELFIVICGLVIGASALIVAISLFKDVRMMLVRPEEKIEISEFTQLFGCLSIGAIFSITFLTSSGTLVYQILSYFRDGSWRSISIIDSISYSFKDADLRSSAGQSLLFSLGEFIPLWMGVIFMGLLFFLIFISVLALQIEVIRAITGRDDLAKGI
jgi:hypothetical protein